MKVTLSVEHTMSRTGFMASRVDRAHIRNQLEGQLRTDLSDLECEALPGAEIEWSLLVLTPDPNGANGEQQWVPFTEATGGQLVKLVGTLQARRATPVAVPA